MLRDLILKSLRFLPASCGGVVLAGGLVLGAGTAPQVTLPSAACFALLGTALLTVALDRPRLRLAGRIVAVGALLLALLIGLKDALPAGAPLPGLPLSPAGMSAGLAVAFVLGSLSLLTCGATRRRVAWSTWLGVGVLVMGIVSLLTVLFDLALGSIEPGHMAWPPALLLLLLASGLITLRPDSDFLGVFLGDNAVGVFARRMIIVLLLLPPVLGFARLYVLHFLSPGGSQGYAFVTAVYMLAGLIVTVWAARVGSGLQAQRDEAEGEQHRLLARLQAQAAGLQEQVAVRTRELEEANLHLQAAVRINSQLSLVASHTTSGVIIADARGRIEWANKAWEHMTGYALAEVIGRRPGEFLRGEETDSTTARRLGEAIRDGKSCYEEILNYARDGRPYWQILDIEPVRNDAGAIVNFISVQTDITQYRESQQQMEALTERLQLALLFSGYGVWEVDLHTGSMTWDARMFEIYGLARTDFDGTRASWQRCVHPDDLAVADGKFSDLVAQKLTGYEIEYRIVRPVDGVQRHVKAQGYVQRDEHGKAVRVVGLNRDITAEYLQREQLHAYTERLQLALRASGYGVWDMDPVSGKLYWDARMFELYGLNAETFDGNYATWAALIHAEDRAKVEASIAVAAASGEEYTNEYRIIRPDGLIRHIEAHGYLRRDAAGRIVRSVGMDRDITAEKEMQEALRLAEERWQLALTGTNDGVWDWNLASGGIFFDQRYAEILGYALSELPQDDRGWMVLVHPDDLSEAMAAREAHVAGQTGLYSAEHRIRTRSGEWKWVLGRGKVVARDAAGHALRMVGTLSDIAERKQLEQEQRRNQELADHVGRLAMIGGWEYDLRTSAHYWSASVRRIHEVPDSFVPTTENFLEFYPPEMRGTLHAAFQRCLSEGEPYDLELPLLTATGRRIWVRTLGRAEMQGGRLVRIYGAFQDISVRHEAEEARRQLETQLFQAQKMETLGTLAGGIAHDFNNLLTGIMGYHDLAADVLPEDHQVRAYLTEARQASMRARELVEQILTFSRQQESPERMPVDLALIVGEARRFLRATLPSTIQIHTEVDESCPRVLADSTQLHQILLNLGSNGAQAMGERGGMLKFALKQVELDPARAAALGGLSSGRYVCLSVSDWGHGMDEATLKRIFDPFFTTKKPGEGTGLGLSVVHGIVRSHQGGIEVESAVGIGTTFRIFLPEAESETQTQSLQNLAVPQGHGDTIFLVDDEEVVAKFAGIALERMGYRVVSFDSALPCLEAIRADPHACDVLVTDQTMPGLTGTDLIEAVHKINPALRAVLMSGYFTKVSVQTLDRLSYVELLNKPFTSEELAAAVQRALTLGAEPGA